MDLGKEINLGEAALTAPQDGKSKVSYPSLFLSDKAAESFITENEPKIGEEFAATVRLRVTGLRSSEGGISNNNSSRSIDFDVIELDDIASETGEDGAKKESPAGAGDAADAADATDAADTSGEGGGEEDEEIKALGYKRPKSKKEAPSLKASDLAD